MKYTAEIEINKPVQRVVELFDDADNMKLWMEGLEKFEHLSGTPGEVGAKSKLTFKIKKRIMEMIETITVKNLPHEFSGTYDVQGVHNIVKNYFLELPGNRTKYVSEQEFQFKGIVKLLGFMMRGSIKKKSMENLAAFKKFA